MKYMNKQKCRRALCSKELRNEKKLIKLEREKNVIDNFRNSRENLEMMDKMLNDGFANVNVLSSERKTYDACKKYIMYSDYIQLLELKDKIDETSEKLNEHRESMKENFNKYFRDKEFLKIGDNQDKKNLFLKLRNEYRDLKKEYVEFKDSLTSTEEEKKYFNSCKSLYNFSQKN